MIVDSSALIAILRAEPDAPIFAAAIDAAPLCRISAATFVEASIVIDTLTRGVGHRNLDSLLHRSDVVIEPVTEEQAHIARQAYADFGKGRHAAGLNFGDCFAYALSKVTGEPLLFKGEDFRQTDVVPAR